MSEKSPTNRARASSVVVNLNPSKSAAAYLQDLSDIHNIALTGLINSEEASAISTIRAAALGSIYDTIRSDMQELLNNAEISASACSAVVGSLLSRYHKDADSVSCLTAEQVRKGWESGAWLDEKGRFRFNDDWSEHLLDHGLVDGDGSRPC